MDLGQTLSKNLKALREQKGLSLGQLAELTGLSKVMLSQLERGGSNPTINNIWKIANALGVPYSALLDEPSANVSVLRFKSLASQTSEDGHYRLTCYYKSSTERNFEVFWMELDAGRSYKSVGHKSRGMEYIILQQGDLELESQGEINLLHRGDAISFQAAEPHCYRNVGNVTVIAGIINYYPL